MHIKKLNFNTGRSGVQGNPTQPVLGQSAASQYGSGLGSNAG